MRKNKLLIIPTLLMVGSGFSFLAKDSVTNYLWHNKDAKFSGLTNTDETIKGIYAKPLVVPSDPNYTTQKSYSMSNVGDIESVWDSYTGKNITIAVIDDGFAPLHPDYTRSDGTSSILSNSRYYYVDSSYTNVYYKEYSSDSTCLNEEYSSSNRSLDTHGTNTSTTAAAAMNSVGGVGIAPDANLLLLKIDMSFPAIKAAISYAVEAGADVINMSLGAYSESFTDGFGTTQSGSSSVATYLNTVCDEAYEKGVIVVAAAGNEATYRKSYPACNNHVVGVGALSKNSSTSLAYYTNYNQSNTTGEKNVDILAPGSVYTASVNGSSSLSSNWTYTYTSTQGTSFASPIVAGTAAVWLEKYKSSYSGSTLVDTFTNELTSTAANIGYFKDKYVDATSYGYSKYVSNLDCGTVDIAALLKLDEEKNDDSSSNTVKVESISLDNASVSLEVNETKEVSATITPSNATNKNVTWSIADTSIASVTSEGLTATIKGLKQGTTTLSVTTLDGNHTATCNITVTETNQPVEVVRTLTLNKQTLTLVEEETEQLVATYSTNDNTSTLLTWSSSDASIASVSQNGLVTALKEGTTNISVTNFDNSKTATCKLTVIKKEVVDDTNSISGTITFESNSSYYDDYYYLSNSQAANYATADESLGDVKIGNVSKVIRAKKGYGWRLGSYYYGGSFDLSFATTLKNPTITAVAASYYSNSSAILTLNEKTLNITSTTLKEYTFELESFDLLSISSSSRLYLQSLTISYKSSNDDSNNQPVEVERELTLNKESLTLKVGEEEKLIATYKTNDGTSEVLTWTSLDTSVASVDSTGLVKALKAGETTITVSNFDSSKVVSCKLIVEEEIKDDNALFGTINFVSTSDSYFDGYSYLTSSTAKNYAEIDSTLGEVSFSNLSRVTQGKSGYGWKFSSFVSQSTLTINFEKVINASKVIVELANYRYSSNTTFSINNVSTIINSTGFKKYEFTLSEFSSLALVSSGRIYIKSIEIVA